MYSKLNKKCKFNSFEMVATMYESKSLSKHISCDCKCTFDGRKLTLHMES